MELVLLGLIVWSGVHFVPVVAPDFRQSLIEKVGALPYRGLFALVILASVALMVVGWRSIESVTVLYDIYDIVVGPCLLLILAGFVLMAASKLKSNFSRTVRHPQLTGFSLWAVAHTLMNGDLRAVVLFGCLSLWAIATIVLTNRRDGAFQVPDKQLPHQGVIVFAVGICVFIAAVLGHQYLSGVDLTVKR